MLYIGTGINSIQIQQSLSRRPFQGGSAGETVQSNAYLHDIRGPSGSQFASNQEEYEYHGSVCVDHSFRKTSL